MSAALQKPCSNRIARSAVIGASPARTTAELAALNYRCAAVSAIVRASACATRTGPSMRVSPQL